MVPHTLRKRDCPDISDFSMVMIVTEWWVEACMYKNKFIEASEGFVYSPFEEYPLEGMGSLIDRKWDFSRSANVRLGFEGLEICLTQFSGIELLHMRKLITLLGLLSLNQALIRMTRRSSSLISVVFYRRKLPRFSIEEETLSYYRPSDQRRKIRFCY